MIWAYSFAGGKMDFCSFLKEFAWETNLWVILIDFTVKNAKLGREIKI